MKLRVLGRFRTVLTVGGSTIPWAGEPGQTFEVEDAVAAALLRDLPGVVVIEPDSWPVAEAITEATAVAVVEMVEVPPEIVAPPVKARTRQVARKPRPIKVEPKPAAKRKK